MNKYEIRIWDYDLADYVKKVVEASTFKSTGDGATFYLHIDGLEEPVKYFRNVESVERLEVHTEVGQANVEVGSE